MRIRASHWLALGAAVLLIAGAIGRTTELLAADPPRPAVEAVPSPAPQLPAASATSPVWRPPGVPPPNNGRPVPAMAYPAVSVPVAAPVPQPNTRQFPINLATALRLSDARPIIIAAAQASVQVATRQLEQARVLWLPNINIGASYYRHDGGVQGSSGDSFVNARNQFMAGGGPYAIVNTADAYFMPLAARQVLRSRTFDVQTVTKRRSVARVRSLLQRATSARASDWRGRFGRQGPRLGRKSRGPGGRPGAAE